MDAISELRRHGRQEILSAVMITPAEEADSAMAMALDLSLGGARVGLLDDWRPAPGTPLWLSFLFDDDQVDQAITLRGHVTRVTVDHLGVEFEPAQDERIQHLLEQFETVH
jgi:hypothetical protein